MRVRCYVIQFMRLKWSRPGGGTIGGRLWIIPQRVSAVDVFERVLNGGVHVDH